MRSDYDLEERFVPGSLRGFRTWKISGEMKLTAINNNFMSWQRGQNEAKCTTTPSFSVKKIDKNHKFDPNCSCGFYARYKPDDIFDTFNWSTVTHIVAGAVKGTGKVAQGTRGYRAEFAQVEAICPLLTVDFQLSKEFSYQETVKCIASRYGVPWYPTMADLIKDFPEEKDPISPELAAKAEEIVNQIALMKKAAETYGLNNVVVYIPGNPQPQNYHFNNGSLVIPPNSIIPGSSITINTTAPITSYYINPNGA